MGCLYSKDSNAMIEAIHSEPLKVSRNKYIEFKDDIDCIRRAAKNICLLSDYDWYIDTIKKNWDITVKDWSHSDLTGTSVSDSQNYLNMRFQQAIELAENEHKIKFPTINTEREFINNIHRHHSFKLAMVIAFEKEDQLSTSKKGSYVSYASLFIVAAEQKGTEGKLISSHALINIPAFRSSIGLPPTFLGKQDSFIDEYDLSYGLDGLDGLDDDES